MAEFMGVIFIRGKVPKDGAEKFGKKSHLILMSTELDMYESCILIDSYKKGIHPEKDQVPD